MAVETHSAKSMALAKLILMMGEPRSATVGKVRMLLDAATGGDLQHWQLASLSDWLLDQINGGAQ